MTGISNKITRSLRRFGVVTFAAVALSACTMYGAQTIDEGIGYRKARFAEMSAMRAYRSCLDDAMELDTKARSESSPAKYLASAKLIEKCESELGPEVSQVGEEERMRAYALSVQNYVKGGDVVKARANLEKFQQAYSKTDLYFADGSSFVDTMEVLLGLRDRSSLGDFSIANVNSEVKSELRRVRYWNNN